MLTDDKRNFLPLPGEQALFTSPTRTSLTLQSFNRSASKDNRFSIDCSAGTATVTNKRVRLTAQGLSSKLTVQIVYLPTSPHPTLQSFSAPILNCQDTHIAAPWFGPNVWTAVIQPVAGGNVPTDVPAIELKMTFKEGGAYDFHNIFERIKERTQHAVDMAREAGHISPGGAEDRGLVDLHDVHLDELPAYEENAGPGVRVVGRDAEVEAPISMRAERRAAGVGRAQAHGTATSESISQEPSRPGEQPRGEPPRYEDVQTESIADILERRLRESEENNRPSAS
jgi:WW domain-binding protein 2